MNITPETPEALVLRCLKYLRSCFRWGIDTNSDEDDTDLFDEYQSNFGPKQKLNQQPIAYAASLETKLEMKKFRTKVEYSAAEILLEMLN